MARIVVLICAPRREKYFFSGRDTVIAEETATPAPPAKRGADVPPGPFKPALAGSYNTSVDSANLAYHSPKAR